MRLMNGPGRDIQKRLEGIEKEGPESPVSSTNPRPSPHPLPLAVGAAAAIHRRQPSAATRSRYTRLCMTALVRLAGRAASWSRGAGIAAPRGLGLLPQRRAAFQGARMANGGGKGGRGALIVLEGLDRSGKSSQCARLLSFLQGKGCATEGWRFPDRDTSVGKMISAYLANESQLDDRTIHLLFSANRWEKRSLMESKLLGGTTLVVDRYSYSGVAFSAAKGLDIGWCKAPEVGLLAPDLVIYLDVQPEKAAERGGYGGERYERVEFQKSVAGHYHSLRDSTWKVVDGSLPMETVEEQLRELAMNCISECQDKQLTNIAW